jgi:hypothetical protein
VLRKRQRAVRAWAEGTVVDGRPEGGVPVTYNPYRCASFTIRSDSSPIHHAEFCHFTLGDSTIACAACISVRSTTGSASRSRCG